MITKHDNSQRPATGWPWPFATILWLVAGCGDPTSTVVEGEADGGAGSRTSPPVAMTSEEPAPPEVDPATLEPLVPPIDLGGDGYIRSATGNGGVDPLGLPVKIVGADFTRDERASFHAHGDEVCASGCAASRHPTPELTKEEYERLIVEFALGPLDESNDALEALVFYGRQTAAWMDRLGPRPLNHERAAFLRKELNRTHALISFRIVDEHGVIRTHMPPTRVPLDRRHVFDMETKQLPPLETSGTVKRVGLHHLWTRL